VSAAGRVRGPPRRPATRGPRGRRCTDPPGTRPGHPPQVPWQALGLAAGRAWPSISASRKCSFGGLRVKSPALSGGSGSWSPTPPGPREGSETPRVYSGGGGPRGPPPRLPSRRPTSAPSLGGSIHASMGMRRTLWREPIAMRWSALPWRHPWFHPARPTGHHRPPPTDRHRPLRRRREPTSSSTTRSIFRWRPTSRVPFGSSRSRQAATELSMRVRTLVSPTPRFR
jgi:hypothetical protein